MTEAQGPECLNGCKMRDTDVPRRTRPPRLLCDPCVDRLAGWLRDVDRRAAMLPAFVAPGTVEDSEIRAPKGPHAPLPIRAEVVSLLDHRGSLSVASYLRVWADGVRAERRLADPPAELTIHGELRLLGKHLGWIVSQPAAKQFYDGIRSMARTLADAVGDKRPRKLGTCVALVGQEQPDGTFQDAPCGGPLFAEKYRNGIRCGWCGDSWGEADLRGLGILLGDQEGGDGARVG